ncbi:hypothetical protein T06_14169 [Trichinella sp. T6]|nr:hypothetical protein T06_12080 [Trichinella sp. T6]KRX78584.1 hypothetical protein T06_14169 [Trichinella sp. T6]
MEFNRTAGVIQIGPLYSRRFHTTESLCPSPPTLQKALTSTFVENQVEANFPHNNLLTVSTDGAPAMVGCHRKFIAQLKNSATDVLAVHCAIRR